MRGPDGLSDPRACRTDRCERRKKGPDDQRHTRRIAYRCYLPVLTEFTSPGCAGPGPQNGGDDGIRTHDPLVANEVLSQLSYIPTRSGAGAAEAPVVESARLQVAAHDSSEGETVKREGAGDARRARLRPIAARATRRDLTPRPTLR